MKKLFTLLALLLILSGAHAQSGINNGLCNRAEAVAKTDPDVGTVLDGWNSGCYRLDGPECNVLGELLVLCAEHPCPAPLYLVELTYGIRSWLCGSPVIPAPGYIKVLVVVGGPGGGHATIAEGPGF